uniref:Putative secreted protein n=1 Tax=Anopheles marajoara TaxID=58244 RepID=A0A2M4C904_9DIPT
MKNANHTRPPSACLLWVPIVCLVVGSPLQRQQPDNKSKGLLLVSRCGTNCSHIKIGKREGTGSSSSNSGWSVDRLIIFSSTRWASNYTRSDPITQVRCVV